MKEPLIFIAGLFAFFGGIFLTFIVGIHHKTLIHSVFADCGDEMMMHKGMTNDTDRFEFAQSIGYDFVEIRETGEYQGWYVVRKSCE